MTISSAIIDKALPGFEDPAARYTRTVSTLRQVREIAAPHVSTKYLWQDRLHMDANQFSRIERFYSQLDTMNQWVNAIGGTLKVTMAHAGKVHSIDAATCEHTPHALTSVYRLTDQTAELSITVRLNGWEFHLKNMRSQAKSQRPAKKASVV